MSTGLAMDGSAAPRARAPAIAAVPPASAAARARKLRRDSTFGSGGGMSQRSARGPRLARYTPQDIPRSEPSSRSELSSDPRRALVEHSALVTQRGLRALTRTVGAREWLRVSGGD